MVWVLGEASQSASRCKYNSMPLLNISVHFAASYYHVTPFQGPSVTVWSAANVI